MSSPAAQNHPALALLQLPGMNRNAVARLLQTASPAPRSPAELFDLIGDHATTVPLTLDRAAVDEAWHQAKTIIDAAAAHHLALLSISNDDFPASLRAIPDPPVVLFIRGDPSVLRQCDAIAIIGTREATPFGQAAARWVAQAAAEAGMTIVSGLARGCDTAAHEACLVAGGTTIATLAHSLDRVYPKENADLAQRIVKGGGALVSEYAPEAPPTRHRFIDRDRLQSGLSLGVVLIETERSGGAMHTVRFASEQGRPVAALAPQSDQRGPDRRSGNVEAIHDGLATPIRQGADLRRFIEQVRDQAPIDTTRSPLDASAVAELDSLLR